MKKITFFSMVMALLLVAGGCAQEGDISVSPNNQATEVSNRVSLKDALKKADRLMSQIEGVSTRSRTVESVEYYGGQNTRSSENSSLYYVVNYADNAGFAVLGADNRLDGVYAISDEGRLEMSDTSVNEGLRLFFLSLPRDIPPFTNDSLIVDPILPPVDPPTPNDSYKVKPMLAKNVKYWHQGSPLNLNCPWVTDPETGKIRKADAGCVPVAVGMIMSYYEWPLSYQNLSFDWKVIKAIDTTNAGTLNAVQEGLPQLISTLGNGMNLMTNYQYSGSGTRMTYYLNSTLVNFKYKSPMYFYDFSVKGMENLLKQNQPCLMGGTVSTEEKELGGHAWVIDGIIYDDDVLVKGDAEKGDYYIRGEGYLFHCVWGWQGNDNGYFKFDGGLKHSNIFSDNEDPDWRSESERINLLFSNIIYCGGFTPDK